MDRFMTAQEIADAGKRLSLTCVPHTKRGVNKRAAAEGWDDTSDLCRKRQGSTGGGGMEYHVSLLPDAMRAALEAEVSRAVSVRNASERREIEIAKREALDTTALSARQRQVMNARSQVLSAIENIQFAEGHTRSQTVDLFVNTGADFGLAEDTIATANDRSNGSTAISRRTILRWFQFRDQSGIGALAPKATKARAEIPTWFWDFLKHYARPQKPCITEALDAYLKDRPRTNEAVTYTKVRRLQFEDEDGMVSAWIDVLGRSTSGVQTYMMPAMGDEVWCALDPKGEDGCLIGSKYNDQTPPPFGSNEDVGLVWPGGSVHVNQGSGAVTVVTDGPVDITTSGDATIKAANIKLESASLTHNGVNIGATHKHSGVAPGGVKTDVPS